MVYKTLLILVLISLLIVGNYSRIMIKKNFTSMKAKHTNLHFFLSGLLFDYSRLNANGREFYFLHLISVGSFFIAGCIAIIVFLNKKQ